MTGALEDRAIAEIALAEDVDQLRRRLRNAQGKSERVEKAAFERLITVSAGRESNDPLARELWKMVFAVEELRRMRGKTWRMNRMRPKIEEQGAEAALEYCALNQTEGFDEVLGYGRPDLLAEAIVIRFSDRFSAEAIRAASERLTAAGIKVKRTIPSLQSGANAPLL